MSPKKKTPAKKSKPTSKTAADLDAFQYKCAARSLAFGIRYAYSRPNFSDAASVLASFAHLATGLRRFANFTDAMLKINAIDDALTQFQSAHEEDDFQSDATELALAKCALFDLIERAMECGNFSRAVVQVYDAAQLALLHPELGTFASQIMQVFAAKITLDRFLEEVEAA